MTLKIALPAGPKAAENYLEMARDHGFDWIDISGSWPETIPESGGPQRVNALPSKL